MSAFRGEADFGQPLLTKFDLCVHGLICRDQFTD